MSKQAVTAAIKWARDGANASLLRLQKAEAASEFAGFVERLIAGEFCVLSLVLFISNFVL